MPLGVGIGDIVGVAKLAKSVITEIKKKNEALTDQIDGQTRNLNHSDDNNDQFELKQACCVACPEPLQKFLDKISKFDPSLEVRAPDGKAVKGVGRRIQWKVPYEEDVWNLRAILMGYTVQDLVVSEPSIR